MIASILAMGLKYLGDEALTALFGFLSQEIQKRNLVVQGMAQQASKETALTAKTEANVAQAISDAPHSRDETITILDMGKF